MQRLVNEIQSLYGVSCRKINKSNKTIAIDLKDYGILLTSDYSLVNTKLHCIEVDLAKLDDRIYCNEIMKQVFWYLVECGYMHQLRMEKPNFFRNLLFDHGWAKKIVDRRLEKWGDQPKYKNLVKINKDFMANVAINFQRSPWFFDFLWV